MELLGEGRDDAKKYLIKPSTGTFRRVDARQKGTAAPRKTAVMGNSESHAATARASLLSIDRGVPFQNLALFWSSSRPRGTLRDFLFASVGWVRNILVVALLIPSKMP
jgi:hypothetical protein